MNTDNNNSGADLEVEKLLNEIRRQQNYTPKKQDDTVAPVQEQVKKAISEKNNSTESQQKEDTTQGKQQETTAVEPAQPTKEEKTPIKEEKAVEKTSQEKPEPKAEQPQQAEEDYVDIYAHLQDLNATVQIPKIKIEPKKKPKKQKAAEKPQENTVAVQQADIESKTNEKEEKATELPAQQEKSPNNTKLAEQPVNKEIAVEAEEQQEKTKKTYIPKVEEQPKEKNAKKSKHIVAAVFVALVLAAGAFAAIMFFNPGVTPDASPVIAQSELVAPKETGNVFVKGIQVAGVDLGGKTVEQATTLLAVKADEVVAKFDVTVNYGEKALQYSQDDFIYTYNAEETVKQAFEYSKQVEQALAQGKDRAIEPPTDSLTAIDKETGAVNFSIPCKVTEASVAKVVKKISNEWDVPVVEPHISEVDTSKSVDEMCKYEDGSEGTLIDTDKLHEDFMQLFKNGGVSGTLTVDSHTEQPKMKLEDVKNSFVKLSEFSTVSSNTWNATENMKQALKYINGSIVRPDGTWSFNECTGDSNLQENGFYPAGVISGGKMTTGVGGGICQAASTIYNAGIRANMEIVERQPHLWCSYYVYGGLDATIDYGAIDLKMKNQTKYDMVLKTWMGDDGVTLHVEIYGWQSDKFDEVRTESEITWSQGEHYGTEAQRVFYLDGKEVGREDLPESTYSTSEGHAMIGGDPGTKSTKIEHPKKANTENTTEAAKPEETKAEE